MHKAKGCGIFNGVGTPQAKHIWWNIDYTEEN